MVLAPLELDDLSWSDMVTAIRGRIASASSARWTLHAPVDPGVTLLELFAWLLEQRVYFLDQVPPSLQRGILTLLGNAALPEVAASTVLAFRVSDPPTSLAVPAGTLMTQRRRGGAPVQFTTDADFRLLPVRGVGFFVGAVDRSLDLAHGRTLLLLPTTPPFEARIVLWLDAPPSAEREPLALLLELTPPVAIPPQWSVDAVAAVPPPAAVSFSYRAAGGLDKAFDTVDDGTGGLRRSGVVRLAIPADWVPETIPAPPDLSRKLPFAVKIAVADPTTFSAPPRIAAVTPNVAIARHTRPASYPATSFPATVLAWAPVAGKPRIPLPAVDRPPIVRSVKLRLRERDGAWHDWTQVDDLSFHGPGDRVFLVDRAQGLITFGCGLTGRMPVLAPGPDSNVHVDYAVGAGAAGNVGSGALWAGNGPLVAVNHVAAEGGAEPEPLDVAQQRVAVDQRKPTRAITADDFSKILENTRIFDEDKPWGVSIRRAYAAVGFLADYPCAPVPGAVTVFIVPDVPHDEPSDTAETVDVSAPQPDPGTLALARQRIALARLVASEVVVSGPMYAPVAVVADVSADPQDPVDLRQRVTDRVRTYLHPLRGGDPPVAGVDGSGWPFGAAIQPSSLLEQIQLALGSDGQATGVAIGVGDAVPAPSCAAVPIGAHRLIDVRHVTVRLSAPALPPGGLR